MATAAEVYGKDIAFKGDFVRTPTGDLATIEGLDNVRDALLRRLITSPGSIVHRPTFGVGIKRFQNAIGSIATQRQIAQDIKEQFLQDPRVEGVSGVSVAIEDLDAGLFKISVRVKLVGYDEQTLQFSSTPEV